VLIDLRSDTVTRPTEGMRAAMARAEVGDDVYGEDPTVNLLQERVAALLGKEAALFVPTGTMANQIAIKVLSELGDEALIGVGAHCWLYESGMAAAFSGVQLTQIGQGGLFTAEDVHAAIKPADDHFAPTRLICVEDTMNRAGGRVWPRAQVGEVLAAARARGLRAHLDGARLWNAHIASGVPLAEMAAGFDTVACCLSKGLGAPLGSLVVGARETIRRAHRVRKMLGGGMRQAGVVAAAGLYALEHHLARLAEDHANAGRLADRLGAAAPETNMVLYDIPARSGCDADELMRRCRAEGVLLGAVGPRRLRLVTHLDIDTAACDRAAAVILGALGSSSS
jgi:threonine aldolase